MKLISLGRITKLGVINFWRNGWLSFVHALILTITLLIITVLVVVNMVISTTSKSIEEKINLAIYFYDQATTEEIQALQTVISKRVDVKSAEYISKEEALQRWQKLQITQKIKEQVTQEENPLPRSLEIKTKSPDNLDSLASFLSQDKYQNIIRNISYQQNKDIIKKLVNITRFSQKLGLMMAMVFITIAVLVILNTVKLAIFSRRDEIEIMRIVGASNYFIDLPFVIESLLIALMATLFSTLFIWLGLHYIAEAISHYLGEISLDLQAFFRSQIIVIIILQLMLSSLISIGCTLVSVRKHLRI